MHKNGYAHRDIKPENVLLDDKFMAVFCDLGLAKSLHGDRDGEFCDRIGTEEYLSSEI